MKGKRRSGTACDQVQRGIPAGKSVSLGGQGVEEREVKRAMAVWGWAGGAWAMVDWAWDLVAGGWAGGAWAKAG